MEEKNEQKPLLFLFSHGINLANAYFLKDVGKVINMEDAEIDIVMDYLNRDFILVNMRDQKQVDKLKHINLDKVERICVLRPHESVNEPWAEKLNAHYKIKSFEFVKNCKSKNEVYNSVKLNSVFKMPNSTFMFYLKKLYKLITCILSST